LFCRVSTEETEVHASLHHPLGGAGTALPAHMLVNGT
jgi:hypothetical protein